MTRLFSLRHEFPTEWHRLMSGTSQNQSGDRSQSFAITKNRFPFLFGQRKIQISAVDLYVVPKPDAKSPEFPALLALTWPKGTSSTMVVGAGVLAKSLPSVPQEKLVVGTEEAGARWEFNIPEANVAKFQKDIEDILMVCHYSI
jgi:hypothetical protein